MHGRARDLEDIDLRMEFDPTTLCWQLVDAEQEEEEEATQKEWETEILGALKSLGKVKATRIAETIGAQRSNTSKRLQQLWKQGRIHMEVIDYVPHYFLKEEGELDGQPV